MQVSPNVSKVIEQATADSLSGRMNFPQVLKLLASIGVTIYHIDFLRSEKTSYLRNGETHVEKMDIPQEPVGQQFVAQDIAEAVKASQTAGLKFADFVCRAKASGCIGYFVYLDGRRVVYHGRLGDEHIELFPEALQL